MRRSWTRRARYWRARALEQSGATGAEDEYRALAENFPLSYYGMMAAARLELDEVPKPEPIDPGTAQLAERDFRRPRVLVEAAMLPQARAELDRLYPLARGLADRLGLAQLYAETGDFYRPELLIVEAFGDRLDGLPAPVDLEGVEARYDRGLLHITLPKREEAG